jgi:broad specificity phosphatase PhoE
MLIFMLRHGMPEFPDDRGYVYGQTDYPLSRIGEAQAARMGGALSNIGMQRIVSSDLARAARTAEIVAGMQAEKTCAPERDPGLREIFMGEWEGLPVDDVKDRFEDVFLRRGPDMANTAPPGGESFAQLQDRGMRAVDRITEESGGLGRILIVAHAGLIWSVISSMFEIPLDRIFEFSHDYCGLHIVERRFGGDAARRGNYRLERYNWLPDPAVPAGGANLK